MKLRKRFRPRSGAGRIYDRGEQPSPVAASCAATPSAEDVQDGKPTGGTTVSPTEVLSQALCQGPLPDPTTGH